MKTSTKICLWLLSTLALFAANTHAQTLMGTWQLVKQENCIESELPVDDSSSDLLSAMKQNSSASAQIVKFKDKGAGEESTRILSRRKSANSQNFLYKRNGELLLILDKKSQTISETYRVDKLTADSLVMSNSSKPCDIKFFLKIKSAK